MTEELTNESESERHSDENRNELQILRTVKNCLMNFGDVEDVISELRRLQRGEAPPIPKPKSLYDLQRQHLEIVSRGDRLESEIEKRYQLMKAVESLLNHALDMKDWERVGIAIDVIEELRETGLRCEPIKDVWNKELKLAYDLF
jgi:hypothetical protein